MSELLSLQETLYTSRNPTRRWLHRTRRARIEATLRRAAAAAGSGRALEVGPGSGVYLPLLCELFDEVVASDVEEAFLANATELAATHPNLQPVADDITASRLPARSFDVVLCSEVIEHIADSAGALRAMHGLLKPGGLLVLSTPQRHSPLELAGRIAFLPGIVTLVRAVYREPILATGHINLLTAPEARGQLAGAGFEVLESGQSGVYLPLVAEFTGRIGLKLERWIERRMIGGRLSGLLWVQYYLALGLTAPTLSIVVPVYDEERRLGPFLESLGAVAAPAVGEMGLELLEVVVVDDGSNDRTPEMLRAAAERDDTFAPLLRGGDNEGKGAALRAGAAAARGDFTLFVDVDMSTPLPELAKLWEHVREGADVAIGSRDVTGSVVVHAPQHRKQIGRTFNFLVRRLTGLPFKDTQCGFKLMRTDTARTLLEHQLVSGYAFDVELLMRARNRGLSVVEVPVTYVHDNDSRVNPLTASPRMALDLMRLAWRLRLRRGG